MIKIFIILTLNLITNSLFSQNISENKVKEETKTLSTKLPKDTNSCESKDKIEIKVLQIDEGWGFDIDLNNKKCIHQPNIPAINGNKTFKTKEDAVKVAELMKSKMCKNIFPPSVTLQEIHSLINLN